METFWSTLRLWQRVLHYTSERTFRQLVDLIISSYNAHEHESMPGHLGGRYVVAVLRVRDLEKEVAEARRAVDVEAKIMNDQRQQPAAVLAGGESPAAGGCE